MCLDPLDLYHAADSMLFLCVDHAACVELNLGMLFASQSWHGVFKTVGIYGSCFNNKLRRGAAYPCLTSSQVKRTSTPGAYSQDALCRSRGSFCNQLSIILVSLIWAGATSPEGPSTQYLRSLIPKAIPLMVFGTRVLQYWVLGPSGK